MRLKDNKKKKVKCCRLCFLLHFVYIKKLKILSVVLTLCLIFSAMGCLTLAVSAEDNCIETVTVDGVVAEAAAGETIVNPTLTAGDSTYTATATWQKCDSATGNFVDTTESQFTTGLYRLLVRVELSSSYVLDSEVTEYYIDGDQEWPDTSSEQSAEFYYVRPVGLQAIDEITLTTADVPAGTYNGPFVTAPSGAPYTVQPELMDAYDSFIIEENTADETFDGTTFKSGVLYNANFTVIPKEGYYFSNGIVTNGACISYMDGSYFSYDGYYRFTVDDKYIANVIIDGFEEPVPYASASTSTLSVPADAGYKIEAEWQIEDSDTEEYSTFNGVFDSENCYRMKIKVTSKGTGKFITDSYNTRIFINGKEYYVEPDTFTENEIVFTTNSYNAYYPFDSIVSVYPQGFTVPKANSTISPVTLTPDDSRYTLATQWVNADKTTVASGKFEKGKTYYLKITATAADGYGFEPDNFLASIDDSDCENGTVTYSTAVFYYPVRLSLEIDEAEVTVTEAKVGTKTTDVKATVPANAPYTVKDIIFFDQNGDEFVGTFEDGKHYSMDVELEAKDGYKFWENVDILLNGKLSQYYYTETSITVSKDYSFKKQIDRVEITYTEPKIDDKIEDMTVKIPDGANYDVYSVSWHNVTDDEDATGTFEDMHRYSLWIVLYPGDIGEDTYDDMGYEFSEDLILVVNGKEMKRGFYSEPGFISYECEFSFLKKIDKVEIPSFPTISKGDNSDELTFTAPDGANYHYEISWSVLDTDGTHTTEDSITFAENHAYRLDLHAVPNAGYEFTDNVEAYQNGTKLTEGKLVDIHRDGVTASKIYNFGLKEISRVEITTSGVTIGQKFVKRDSLTVPENAGYSIESFTWYEHDSAKFNGFDSEVFAGNVNEGKYYTFNLWLNTEPGYIFSENVVVTVDGKEIDLDDSMNFYNMEQISVTNTVTPTKANLNNSGQSNKDNNKDPKTSDNSALTLYVIIMLLSGAALITLIKHPAKKN